MSEPTLSPAAAARRLAAEIKRRWRKGESPDAAAALAAHPELTRHQSVVLELAYEEYLLREAAGDAPSPASFAAGFPAFRSGVRSVIAAHQHFLDQPDSVAGDDWPEVGATVADVELVAVLGTGAFGRAYLAYDPNLEQVRVLKLTAGVSAEAKVLAPLDHPHVVKVLWARPVDGRTAVCMPLVGVNTLAEVIAAAFPEGGAPPATADAILAAADADDPADRARGAEAVVRAGEPYLVGAAAVAARVADAVAYLDEQGVTHGDLKPANVVLGRAGAPYLIDFNLSTRGAGPAAVRGTPGYMAPELLDAVAADPLAAGADLARADLFALGVVVYELLTGRRPFPAADPKSFAAQAAAARTPPAALPAGLPRKLQRVLAACLSPDPAARPASAAALADALNRFVAAARTPPAPGRIRRRVAAVAGVVLLLAAVRAGGAAIQPPERSSAPTLPLPPGPPTTPEAFITRGLAKMRAEDWPGARADFAAANGRSPSRWAVAMVAYCAAAGANPTDAIDFSRQVDREEAAPPDVLNNLGYAFLQAGRPDDAIGPLDRAVAGDKELAAARYNRAVARFRVWRYRGGAIDPGAVADVREAIAGGLDSPEVRFDAARIVAVAADADPALRAEALGHVRAGVAAGKPAVAFRADSTLRARFLTGFGSALAFEAACAGPPGLAPPKPVRGQLVEPRPF